MVKTHSIQIKAAFLLIVFVTNTIVGFACSMGLDMGFNSKHHSERGAEEVVHVHANGKKHVHQKTTSTNSLDQSHYHNKVVEKSFVHEHSNGTEHVHHEKTSNHKTEVSTVNEESRNNKDWKSESDNCCNDKVMAFDQLAKSLVHPLHILNPVFFYNICFFI